MTGKNKNQVFVVCEAEAFEIENAPVWLNQDNWMCDWIFVGATSKSNAIAVAAVVDEMRNKRKGRTSAKAENIMAIRGRIMEEDVMTPRTIYATQGNSVDSERLQFNQGWVVI
jgi:hypothetical protein